MPNAPGQPGVQGRWLPGTPKEEGLPDLPGTERQGGGAPRLCVFLMALTGVTATNTSTKLYAGTSIGFISLFSYVGVAVSGKVCGSLAQSSGGWRMPVLAIVGVAAVGCALFVCLWNVRANSYGNK